MNTTDNKQLKTTVRKNTLNTTMRLACMASCILAVTGCSTLKNNSVVKSIINTPSPELQVAKGAVNDMKAFKLVKHQFAKPKVNDPLRLQTVKIDNDYITASRGGELVKLNRFGETIWQIQHKSAISSGVVANTDVAIFIDSTGSIHAIDASTGSTVWHKDIVGTVVAPLLMHNNAVYVLNTSGEVFAFSLDGEFLWHFRVNAPKMSLRTGAKPVAVDDNTIVIASADGRVHAINAITGAPIWHKLVANGTGSTSLTDLRDVADPVYDEGMLYTTSYKSHLVGSDVQTNTEVFQTKMSSTTPVALNKDSIFVSTTDGELIALSRYAIKEQWKKSFSTEGSPKILSNPVAINTSVYVGDDIGTLYRLDSSTGTIVGTTKLNGAINHIKHNQNKQNTYTKHQLFIQTAKGEVSIWQAQ